MKDKKMATDKGKPHREGAFNPGASPLESVLTIYPVVQHLASFLPTPDMLTLSRVSSSLRFNLRQNGAFRTLSTLKEPLDLVRAVKSVADMRPAETFSGFAQFIRRSSTVGYIDHSRVVKIILDGSNVNGAFVMAVVMSAPNLVLLSIKNCQVVQLSMVKRLLDNPPEGLRTLMVWGLPKTGWLYVPLVPTVPPAPGPDSITSIIKRCESMGIDIDIGPCTTKKNCRGRAMAVRKLKFDPLHPMFTHQIISKKSIMMCEKKPIECGACGVIKNPQGCLECMTAGKNTFGFCGVCRV